MKFGALVVVAIGVFMGGCGSDGGGGGTGGSAQGTGGGSNCQSGIQCACNDGRIGVVQCIGGSQACTCDACPAFTPSSAPDFQPCGGEPFGTWRAKSDNPGAIGVDIYVNSSQGIVLQGTCATQIESETSPTDLRLDLQSGGDAQMALTGPELDIDLLDSCVKSKAGASCTALQSTSSDTLSCTVGECGICSCHAAHKTTSYAGTWTRTDTTLTVQFGSNSISMPYCVQNGAMTVQLPSGTVVTMQLAATSGTPTPCNQRTAEQCTLGSGCYLGACVGATSCASASKEADCTNQAGCSWNPNGCAGTASPSCSLADYDVVPGCSFADGQWACIGSPPACDVRSTADCKPAWGCQPIPRCIGGPLSCSDFGCNGCPNCSDAPGCAPSNTAPYCDGTTTCEAQTLKANCEWDIACKWLLCQGTAIPCSQFDSTTCSTVLGCNWQITGQ